MDTKKKLLRQLGLDNLGKIASKSLNKTKQSINKTFKDLKKKRDEEIAKKIKKEKIEQEKIKQQKIKDEQQRLKDLEVQRRKEDEQILKKRKECKSWWLNYKSKLQQEVFNKINL